MKRRIGAVVVSLTLVAVAGGAGARERLPSAKPGPILPSAAGVVLGKTTKAQLLKRWGPATQCHTVASPVCSWFIGTGFDLEDSVQAAFANQSNVLHLVTFYSPSWRQSRLRGWSLPKGIRIGSTFAATKRAYPTLRWLRSSGKGSSWSVERHELGGQEYRLGFFLDKGAAERASGRLLQIDVLWYGRPLRCTLASVPADGPGGEPAGRRIRGTCSGAESARLHEAGRGGIRPLRLEFTPRGSEITSVAGPRCPGAPSSGGEGYADCKAGAKDWPIDVTLGLDSEPSSLEVTVNQPVGVPAGTAGLRFKLP